jgi:hypothetical protein
MYIFNDYEGYGILEVLQNLVLDFIEAKDNWKEQWAVCESIPLYWISNALMPFTMYVHYLIVVYDVLANLRLSM